MKTIRIATRESALAKWQADWVATQLKQYGFDTEMVYVTTHGDVHQSGPIESIGTQGVFTKEVQRAVLDNRADVAVHSMKDLPTQQVLGLVLASVPSRAPVSDCLVSKFYRHLNEIPDKAVVGTGSLRRKAQLLAINPTWNIQTIRGNLQTRLSKLRVDSSNNLATPFDAIILAEAGLRRMGYDDQIAQVIPLTQLMPAAGQGALALECRKDDEETIIALSKLTDASVYAATSAERTLLAVLEAGCLAPVGCTTRILPDNQLELTGRVIAADGSQMLEQTDCSTWDCAFELGKRVAENLLSRGAGQLIAQARGK